MPHAAEVKIFKYFNHEAAGSNTSEAELIQYLMPVGGPVRFMNPDAQVLLATSVG